MKYKDVFLPEILFEFRKVGNAVRVSAIDPITGTEVTTVASTKHTRREMKAVAGRKLRYVLAKNASRARNK